MIIKIICILVFLASNHPAYALKFILKSNISDNPNSNTEVPSIQQHRFSCQLVFFNVHQNCFYAIIEQIPEQIKQVTLEALVPEEGCEFSAFKSQSSVLNNTAAFYLNLSHMSRSQNFQIIMHFRISYNFSSSNGIEVKDNRKAYLLFCENTTHYIIKLPSRTIIITQIIGLIVLLILPWNIQYRKFLPFTFNLLSCSLYIFLLVIGLYLQTIFNSTELIYQIQKYSIGIFQLTCLILYSHDLLKVFIQRNWIAFVIGTTFSIVLMGFDFFVSIVQDAWFLNCIIAIMVAGAIIKFVIIRKVKTAVWALSVMWFFCLIRQFAKQIGIQKFDQGLGQRVIPLFLQLPNFFDDGSSITCSAFGSSKMVAFGVILNYCNRVDLSLSTHFYRTLISATAFCCIGVELIFNLLTNDLPTTEMMSILLFYPIAIVLLLFFANKRGQWAEIWHGSFYDLAVNRASIERDVSFESIESSFGQNLLINGSGIRKQEV